VVAVASALGWTALVASTIGLFIALVVEDESLQVRLIVAATIVSAIVIGTWVALQARQAVAGETGRA
jgi:hypothetical protein